MQKFWKEFRGKGNSDAVLIEKAKAVAPLLDDLITESTQHLFSVLKEERGDTIDQEKFSEVYFEIALFYVHLIDRIAFQYLGPEKRIVFIESVCDEYLEITNKDFMTYNNDVNAAEFRTLFLDSLNERQLEYGTYKMSTEKDEALAGTVLWEFGKKIAEILNCAMDIWVIMYVHSSVLSPFEALHIPELLKP